MKRPDHIPAFSKALLAGALTGLAATVVNLVYNIAYRGITRYVPSEEFNFFSITLASMLLLVITGLIFFLFIKYSNRKVFDIVFAVIIIICLCLTIFVHPANEPILHGNHGLLAGFILITGLLGLIMLPYLYYHPKLFI